MPIRKILTFNHPILKQACEKVTEINDEVKDIIQDLKDTIESKPYGVGLAAPQIGYNKQIVLIFSQEFINPTIVRYEGEQIAEEACMSYPKLEKYIKRPQVVTVRGLDQNGDPIERTYEEHYAVVACHLIDHLHGICKVGNRAKGTNYKKSKKNKKKKK